MISRLNVSLDSENVCLVMGNTTRFSKMNCNKLEDIVEMVSREK